MPITQNKCSKASIRASKNWNFRNMEHYKEYQKEYNHNDYYHKNIEKRRLQALHYKFVRMEFEKFRKILLE